MSMVDDPHTIRLAARMHMALAEAGYPEAEVWIENGIHVEGAPWDLVEKAFQLSCGSAPALPSKEEK